MTAQVVSLFPTGSDADETIRRTVKALMHGRGLNVEEVAPLAGIAVATLYRRLKDEGASAFKAGEVASLARVLDVDPGQLYTGLGGHFVPPTPPGVSATPDYPQLLSVA